MIIPFEHELVISGEALNIGSRKRLTKKSLPVAEEFVKLQYYRFYVLPFAARSRAS